MPDSIPPIWVVSLRRSIERRTRMEGQFARLGLRFEFTDAADARELSAGSLAEVYSVEQTRRLLGREMTPGEIGCSLSHLEIYRRFLASEQEELIVLEDDVVLDAVFREVLASRHRLPEGWDVVHLHAGSPLSPPVVSLWGKRKLAGRCRCVRFASTLDGSFGYLLRRSGAEKMLKNGYPVRVPSDLLTGGVIDVGLRYYGISPPLIWHGGDDSTMPDAHALRSQIELGRRRASWVRWFVGECHTKCVRLYRRVAPLPR